MNKLFLTVAAMAVTFASFGQRNIDLKTLLHSPSDGQVIKSAGTFNIKYTYVNLGPDTIGTSDTMLSFITLGGNVISNFTQLLKFQKNILPNDSVAFAVNNVKYNGTQEFTGVPFCAIGNCYNRNPNDSLHEKDYSNNSACNNVDYIINTGVSGSIYIIGSAEVMAFPNPANDVTRFTYDLSAPDMVTLSIYDISGKLVKTIVNQHQGTGVFFENFETSDLAPGIYPVVLKVGDRSSTTKLSVVR